MPRLKLNIGSPAARYVLAAGALARIALLLMSHDWIAAYRLPDDALYYFAIAKHAAQGAGISFNGLAPTNGFHPLWLFVLFPIALVQLAPWAFITCVLVIQTLIDIASIVVLARIVETAADGVSERARNFAVTVAVASYALSATAIVRGINGLETSIAAYVLLVWLRNYCELYRDGLQGTRGTISSSIGRIWSLTLVRFGVWSGLLFLARTDFAVILVVSVMILLLVHRRMLATAVRPLLLSAALAGGIVLPWLVWNLATFGSIVQVSADAVPLFAHRKLTIEYPNGYSLYLIRESARNMLKPFFYCACGLPLIILGTGMISRLRQTLAARLAGSGIAVPVFGSLMLLLYHSLVRTFIRDWYVLQLLPMISVLVGATVAYGLAEYALLPKRIIAVALVLGLGLQLYLEVRTPRYPSQVVMLRMAESLSKFQKSAAIGAFNSGYYGYFASPNVRVENLDGVVNPAVYPALVSGRLHQFLDRDSIGAIVDFRETLRGYQGLFDANLFDSFPVRHWYHVRGSDDSLELLGRSSVLF